MLHSSCYVCEAISLQVQVATTHWFSGSRGLRVSMKQLLDKLWSAQAAHLSPWPPVTWQHSAMFLASASRALSSNRTQLLPQDLRLLPVRKPAQPCRPPKLLPNNLVLHHTRCTPTETAGATDLTPHTDTAIPGPRVATPGVAQPINVSPASQQARTAPEKFHRLTQARCPANRRESCQPAIPHSP